MDPPTLPLEFDARGLVPVVVQDHLTGEIRMVAFATDEAVKKTLESGQATFWSRSRSELWQKGLTSGNAIRVLRVLVDCDADCLVYQGEPSCNSCHTGAPTCFFREIEGGAFKAYPAQQTLLGTLEAVLEARKGASAAASYTKSLYEGGPAAIGAKIREEAGELAQAVEGENDQRVISEAADTLYHLLVGLRWRAIPFRRVLAELARRLGKSGHEERASR
jgi:phosphoribosyl-ATP pyrophosphohydrolase/phosphoribosyl-AMP cyclohydrolase